MHRHLLTVWNPSYSGDALDAHLEVLLEWARRFHAGEAEEDDVYVWWGRIRSKNRDGALPHHDAVLALDAQTQEPDAETHLYLTDYRSLYVAQVGEITDEDVRKDLGELAHMPEYYEGHAADFWFRLFDIRRIVSDDTPGVIAEASLLRNTAYHDRPVSLYGGMVDLPLIVFRDPEAHWFAARETLTEGRLWAERAAVHRSETERIGRELRDNLFGRELWARLEPSARTFLASAEAVFRARRDDPAFDFSAAAVEYAKAVEAELNALVFGACRRALAGKPPHEREVRVDARLLDLGGAVPHQTLGVVRNLVAHEGIVQGAVKQKLRHDSSWVLGVLPKRLDRLVELRNAGAHSRVIDASDLVTTRDEVIGVGGEGMLVKLVLARLRGLA